MNVEEGQGLRNQRSDKNRFQAWMTSGGKHPLSREQGGCLDKVYFERGFIYMTGGKWLENKK